MKIAVAGATGRAGRHIVAARTVAEALVDLRTTPTPPANGRPFPEIAGPRSPKPAWRCLTALAARLLDTPIEYVALTPEEHRIDMACAGEDPWWAYAYSTMFASIREQRWVTVSDQVLRITGTAATSVADVLLRAT